MRMSLLQGHPESQVIPHSSSSSWRTCRDLIMVCNGGQLVLSLLSAGGSPDAVEPGSLLVGDESSWPTSLLPSPHHGLCPNPVPEKYINARAATLPSSREWSPGLLRPGNLAAGIPWGMYTQRRAGVWEASICILSCLWK